MGYLIYRYTKQKLWMRQYNTSRKEEDAGLAAQSLVKFGQPPIIFPSV